MNQNVQFWISFLEIAAFFCGSLALGYGVIEIGRAEQTPGAAPQAFAEPVENPAVEFAPTWTELHDSFAEDIEPRDMPPEEPDEE